MIDLYKCGFIYFNYPIPHPGEFLVLSSQAGPGRPCPCSWLSLTPTSHSLDDLGSCGVCVVTRCSPGICFSSLSEATLSLLPSWAPQDREMSAHHFFVVEFAAQQWHPTRGHRTWRDSGGVFIFLFLIPREKFLLVASGTGTTVL